MNTVESMRKPSEPKFDMDSYDEILITTQQKEANANIEFEGYEYDSAFRIVKLKVALNGLQEHHFDYLEEQVLEMIGLRLNKNNIVLETKVEYV